MNDLRMFDVRFDPVACGSSDDMTMIDWQGLFGLSVSPWELVIRGTTVYWFLVLLFRLVLRLRAMVVEWRRCHEDRRRPQA